MQVRGRVRRAAAGRFVLELALEGGDYAAKRTLAAGSCQSLADAAAWLTALALDPSLSEPAEAAPPPSSEPAGVPPRAAEPSARAAEPAALAQEPPQLAADAPHEAAAANQSAAVSTQTRTPAAPPSKRAAPEVAQARAESVARSDRPTTSSRARARAPAESSSAAKLAAASSRARLLDAARWWRAGLFTGAWDASLPAPQAELGARAGYGMGWLLLELRGGYVFGRSEALGGAARARFASQELGPALCAQWGRRVRGGACAVVALLRTTGSVRGTTAPRREALLWAASGAALQLGWKTSRWLELLAEVGINLPVTPRPRFTIEGFGEVDRASPINVYARVGFGFRGRDVVRPKR